MNNGELAFPQSGSAREMQTRNLQEHAEVAQQRGETENALFQGPCSIDLVVLTEAHESRGLGLGLGLAWRTEKSLVLPGAILPGEKDHRNCNQQT